MTKKEIQKQLAGAKAQRDYARRMLRENFDALEAKNEETRWFRLYLNKKAEVEWLENQVPDDD